MKEGILFKSFVDQIMYFTECKQNCAPLCSTGNFVSVLSRTFTVTKNTLLHTQEVLNILKSIQRTLPYSRVTATV